jgi:uncharacterized phage protein (TIGR02218 family)
VKTLDSSLATHLASGTTTLCRCWKLERRDGTIQGFTDHDRDLAFDGVTYKAASGLSASRVQSSLGLTVDDLSVIGALSDDSLTEADLAKGAYDEAKITLSLVNWQDVSLRTILKTGYVGEVTRSDQAFTAEVRGLATKLNESRGRVYRYGCDADLGDARCGVDLTSSAYKGTGEAATIIDPARIFAASGLGAFAAEQFTRGRLLWAGGGNSGIAVEVKRHTIAGGVHTLELWLPMPQAIAVGDGFEVTAGCDKQFSTCKAKFANQDRFRGFPYMPGNDFVVSYPGSGDIMDGGSRYK